MAPLRNGRAAAALALLAAIVLLPACATTRSPADGGAWTVADARKLGAGDALLRTAGWDCSHAVDLPAGEHRLLALCRRGGSGAAPELHLLLLQRPDDSHPAVLSRLGDASRAELRLFTPARTCSGAAACIAGLVLIDQRDEGTCYGTQVIAVAAARPAQDLGFIEEWIPADGEAKCLGSALRVSGTTRSVDITLQGPLARTGRDGRPIMIGPPTVRYRISASEPALVRR